MSWGAAQYARTNRREYREALSTHHRRPRSLDGTNEARNLIELPRSKHSAWHILFQNWPAERIAFEINNRYLDPDYEFVVRRKACSSDSNSIHAMPVNGKPSTPATP